MTKQQLTGRRRPAMLSEYDPPAYVAPHQDPSGKNSRHRPVLSAIVGALTVLLVIGGWKILIYDQDPVSACDVDRMECLDAGGSLKLVVGAEGVTTEVCRAAEPSRELTPQKRQLTPPKIRLTPQELIESKMSAGIVDYSTASLMEIYNNDLPTELIITNANGDHIFNNECKSPNRYSGTFRACKLIVDTNYKPILAEDMNYKLSKHQARYPDTYSRAVEIVANAKSATSSK